MGHSSVWRCDRCGTQSGPQPGSESPEGWRELGLTPSAEDADDDPFVGDLCPSCVAALERWMQDVS